MRGMTVEMAVKKSGNKVCLPRGGTLTEDTSKERLFTVTSVPVPYTCEPLSGVHSVVQAAGCCPFPTNIVDSE